MNETNPPVTESSQAPDITESVTRYMRRHHIDRWQPTAALIDMDGTLYDSMPRHAKAWYCAMTEAGVPCTESEFFLYEGQTGEATIAQLIKRELKREASPEECRRLYVRKTEFFRDLYGEAPLMPGAQKLIDTLLTLGLTTVLVTGSGQRTIIDRLDTDFPGAFPAHRRITSADVTHGKPHPEPFERGMAKADASPWQCIAIDNAPLGVESAARSGAFTIGVVTGPLEARALHDAGADIVFPSMPAFAASDLRALLGVHTL